MVPGAEQLTPHYWHRAKRALARRDPVMRGIMRRHPRIALTSRGDPFQTLARSIVGQQISVKAADSVWTKLLRVAPGMRPEEVVAGRRRLLAAGLSRRKREYLLDLARRFANGSLQAARWTALDDEAVIEDLVQVRGIGRWTAEMFLIFNLLRPDVFPLGDLGLQKGLRLAYHGGRKVSLQTMRRRGETLRPWRSVATWYLWRSLDPLPVEY